MLFITQEEEISFDKDIKVFYFYANWMPFHKKMLLMLDTLEKKYPQMSFISIDTDSFQGLCKRFDVESIPSILIFFKGKEIKRVNGVVMSSALKNMFFKIEQEVNNEKKAR